MKLRTNQLVPGYKYYDKTFDVLFLMKRVGRESMNILLRTEFHKTTFTAHSLDQNHHHWPKGWIITYTSPDFIPPETMNAEIPHAYWISLGPGDILLSGNNKEAIQFLRREE